MTRSYVLCLVCLPRPIGEVTVADAGGARAVGADAPDRRTGVAEHGVVEPAAVGRPAAQHPGTCARVRAGPWVVYVHCPAVGAVHLVGEQAAARPARLLTI